MQEEKNRNEENAHGNEAISVNTVPCYFKTALN